MKTIKPSFIKPLSTYQFWLLTLAGALIAVDISLNIKLARDIIAPSLSLLLWSVILSKLWEKRHTLSLNSDIFSSLLGLVLIAFVLVRSLVTVRISLLLDFLPVISALALILLASGIKGFNQYRQELLLILVLNISDSLLGKVFDPSNLTARFATYIMSCFGFKAVLQGINIVTNAGTVAVLPGCSGLVNMLFLWQLAILFIVTFPANLAKKNYVPVVAVSVGFIFNAARVALLTVLITNSQEKAFEYWHDGDGSQIFVIMSVLVFGAFCYFLIETDEPANPDSREYPDK
ncbi:exosortase [Crinalium epipsammum PCC 9333]|uniref:Exosortase n=1 Tax=Crinalium epipsammum PCC 9333 TaxID=1173022 RepID=K9W1F9_9CYAN|nr:cyanoexosortase A [Crinalium epipsammum]AFZ13634.1 exosortase [Crinalium epipsammum PCC 9333]